MSQSSDSSEARRQLDMLDINNPFQLFNDIIDSITPFLTNDLGYCEDDTYIVPETTSKFNVRRLQSAADSKLKCFHSTINIIQKKLINASEQLTEYKKANYRYKITEKKEKQYSDSILNEKETRKRNRQEEKKERNKRQCMITRLDDDDEEIPNLC